MQSVHPQSLHIVTADWHGYTTKAHATFHCVEQHVTFCYILFCEVWEVTALEYAAHHRCYNHLAQLQRQYLRTADVRGLTFSRDFGSSNKDSTWYLCRANYYRFQCVSTRNTEQDSM